MYVVESKGGTIACMLLALLLLGTWPAILTLLERRARLPQHTYLDYSITNLSAAVLIALTFGQIGETKADMPNFLTQLSQDNWPCVLFTMVGGVFLSLGNLSTQYAFAFLGLSVTEVITASITVVIVLLGAAVHSSNAADNKAKLGYLSSNYKEGARDIEFLGLKDVSNEGGKDLENGSIPVEKAKFGTADFLVELGNRRSIKSYVYL
ncbi:hypothetical protein GIB67_000655 [Kingdonia uniflora]|uniref:Uncharacterized protein n=1 Tax=Kingdonia uniflora TaxID=39325 RepID=A0A7J7NCV1_9MAGN|nr:hypothetical protein GIB67_000655 [Kingdonia uniflora]